MKITADTNVLLRAFLTDDASQSEAAIAALEKADLVAVSLHALCEFVWVLTRRYAISRADVAAAVKDLMATRNVVVDRVGVDAGLAALEAGGDFADGVLAHQGRWLGGETFVSFDKKAVRAMKAHGHAARLLN